MGELIDEAKKRIAALKRSIQTFQDMRDSGMDFPDGKRGNRLARIDG